MSDHPKISIISTVYNTGPYLRPAVESILAQTFTDFELLLVDDGSHDGSAAVCDALAQEDARIRVFHQPNGGPAHARNTGLDNARGDYIGMVDSDDLIEPTMFATLYSAVQVDGVRLAACAGDCIDADGKKIEGRMVTIRQGGVRDAQELLLEAFQTGSFYGPLSWNKLFDARLFKEKGIHYDETMLFGDDASVLHRVFEGERCNCLTDVLYHYRTRAEHRVIKGAVCVNAVAVGQGLQRYRKRVGYIVKAHRKRIHIRFAEIHRRLKIIAPVPYKRKHQHHYIRRFCSGENNSYISSQKAAAVNAGRLFKLLRKP